MSWYLGVWKKYAVFDGRARRKEYWFFYLFNLIFLFVLSFIDAGIFGSRSGVRPLYTIYSLAVLIPHIAVTIRRMHDTDHRGWWLLFPLVNLVLLLMDGTSGPNRFGPDPKSPIPARSSMNAPAAWLPDPTHRHQLRYWDSVKWTSAVADDGVVSVDELEASA